MTISFGTTLYDKIPYPGGVFPSTHPEHLATLATMNQRVGLETDDQNGDKANK
jgi:hypothetical protein